MAITWQHWGWVGLLIFSLNRSCGANKMSKADALLSSPGATQNGHFTPDSFFLDQEMSTIEKKSESIKVKLWFLTNENSFLICGSKYYEIWSIDFMVSLFIDLGLDLFFIQCLVLQSKVWFKFSVLGKALRVLMTFWINSYDKIRGKLHQITPAKITVFDLCLSFCSF